MTIEEFISRLASIAEAAPGRVVMLRRGDRDWFDDVEDVTICRMNRDRNGLECGPYQTGDTNGEEVVVIH